MTEGDHVDVSEEVNPSVPTLSQPPHTHAPPPPTPTGMLPAYSGAPPTHLQPPASLGAPLPPASPTSAATNDQARIVALEGTVNQMATNMAELLALLRGPNRASSSSTPPSGPGPTDDPTPWAPSTQAPENVEAPAPPTLYTSTIHPFTSQLPPPLAPSVVPLPPATFLSSEHILSAPPPVSIPASAMVYTVPPPTAEDIPTWEDLSRKFTDQYRYCAETPPTLLELSTKEMARGQKFEEYAVEWHAQAAKHIPLISEAQQIQLFRSTLRGVMEDPTNKGEESSKKTPATSLSSSGRRGKEISVNAVNAAQQAPQQYSMNYTAAPPVASSYAPQAPQYRPQAPTQPIYYFAPPPPPLPTVSSPVVHHYAPAPSQSPQYQPPAARTSQPTQRALPSQGQQSDAVQPRPCKQYPALPVPLSHIYRQIRDKGSSINMITVCTSSEGESEQGWPSPVVIEYVTTEITVGFAGIDAPHAPLVIDVPALKPYSNDRVPWTYDGGVGNLERQFGVMGIARSGRLYENPATIDKGKAPAKGEETRPSALPTSSKKMAKSPAHISLLALLLNSEPHREALLRVLTATQVPKSTPPDRIKKTINSIFSSTISFSDDELPSEGCAHFQALHIVCKCNNHIIGRVMIDNGSVLNVCPVTTLKQMNVELNRIRPSKTAVWAFDGSRREVNGEIDLLIDIGPCSFSITFQVLDIPNAFSLLLGRPWIYSAGAIPSSLHQKTISVIRDYGEVGPAHADRMIGKVLLRHNYIPGTGLGAREQGINRPIEIEEYKHRRGLGFRPSCHEIVEARRGNHLHRLATHYGRLNRGMPVPPLSHFFPGPPLIIENTSDGPSSDFDDTIDALPTVYAVTEEIPSGVHIRPRAGRRGVEQLDLSPALFGYDRRCVTFIYSLRRLEDRQLTSLEPTEEINVGTQEGPHVLRIGTSLDPTQRVRMIDFLTRYQEVFAWSYADMPGLDPSIVKHFLPLDTEKFPPKRQQLRQRRASLLLRIKEEKDGRVRVCVDYRDLNKASPKDNFPLPHIDVLVDNTARHAQFSFMDGFSGYNQIRMAEEDKIKTTFTTMWGTFCYRIMPFGLKNAGATYQRAMEYKLRLNPVKCTFGAQSGKLLGFVVSERGIEVDPDKVKAIKELPPPSLVREVRGFLGRLNYIARFIANLTDKCQSLFRLLRKNAAIEWDEECQKAFDTIKAYLGQAIADHLAKFPIEDHTPINPDFPDEGILQIDDEGEKLGWKMYFDGAVNSAGSGISAVLISPDGHYYSVAAKIDFPCTNNVAEYEACILGLQAAIDFKENLIEPLEIEIAEGLAHCNSIEASEAKPWYEDIKNLLQTGMDVIGPINPKASNGHMFILVVIDYFTKWIEAVTLASVTAKAVARFLKLDVIARYGVPLTIITDNAKNLNNKHEMLPHALLAYHTSIRTSTGATPYSLVYGMEVVLPIEVEIPSMRILAEAELKEAEWAKQRYEQLNFIDEKRLKALCHGQCYQQRMARAFNGRVRHRDFNPGDLVLRKVLHVTPDSRGKFSYNYDSPFVVREVFFGGAGHDYPAMVTDIKSPTHLYIDSSYIYLSRRLSATDTLCRFLCLHAQDFASPDFASSYCFSDSASTLLLSGLRVPGICVRLLLSELRVHLISFKTSRPRTLRLVTAFRTPRPPYCFQDFASPDFPSGYCFPDSASTLLLSGLRVPGLCVRLLLSGLRVPGLCVRLLLSGLRVHFIAFRTSRHRTLRPDFASPDFASGYCFPDSASTLLLLGLRVTGLCVRLLLSGLRVHFIAFRTSRHRTLRPDFASPDFASGYCFPDSASTLLLLGLRVTGLCVRLLLSGLRVHFIAFRTSRHRTLRPDFASPDFASGYCFPDSASTLLLLGLRVTGLCVRLLLSGLRVHFIAFRTSRHRTLRPDFASPDFASGYYFQDFTSPDFASGFIAFKTSRPRTLRPDFAFPDFASGYYFQDFTSPDFASGFIAFKTSRPRTLRPVTAFQTPHPLYCFQDFASPDFASGYCFQDFASPDFTSRFIAFRTSRPRTLHPVTAFRTPRPLYCFQDFASPDFAFDYCFQDFASPDFAFGYCFQDFASPDFASGYCFPDAASTLLLSGLRVPGLCVRLLLSGLRVHLIAFRTSHPRTLRPVTAFRTPHPLYCFQDFASPDFAFDYCFQDFASPDFASGYCFQDFASPDFASGTQGPPGSGNKLQVTLRNSTRCPEVRFSGHERLLASLWGISTENRDHDDLRAPHNGPRAPLDIQGTRRKPRSKSLGHPGPTESNEPDLAPCRDRNKCADPFFSDLPRLSPLGLLTARDFQPGHPTLLPLPRLFPSYIKASLRTMTGNGPDPDERGSLSHGLSHGTHGQVSRKRP
ncbi:hypothetical protein CRG98_030022, partial [Punica granatum]